MNRTELIQAIAEEIAEEMLEHIEKLEPLTNGEVIKALFPSETMFEQTEACTYYGNMRFDTEWWNAPYKAESEEV